MNCVAWGIIIDLHQIAARQAGGKAHLLEAKCIYGTGVISCAIQGIDIQTNGRVNDGIVRAEAERQLRHPVLAGIIKSIVSKGTSPIPCQRSCRRIDQRQGALWHVIALRPCQANPQTGADQKKRQTRKQDSPQHLGTNVHTGRPALIGPLPPAGATCATGEPSPPPGRSSGCWRRPTSRALSDPACGV